MIRRIKSAAAAAVSASGLAPALSKCLNARQISILMYHGVVRDPLPVPDWCFLERSAFREQIAYLKEHFRVIPLSEAVSVLSDGGPEEPTAVVTFDDGFQNTRDEAFPVLREFGVPATVFLTTGVVDTGDTLWFCRLIRALERTRLASLEWRGGAFELSGAPAKASASAALQALLKRLPAPDLNSALEELCSLLGVDPRAELEPGSPFRMLRSDSIREMRDSGLVEFGAHTQSHSILSLLSPSRQRGEITASLDAVGRLSGRRCVLFAYPNGRPGDYGPETISILRASGVRGAATTVPGPNGCGTPLLELRRYPVGPDLDMPAFELMVNHLI